MSHGKSRAHVTLCCVFVNTPPNLSQVTALATRHKSSVSLNLTGAMNNLIGGHYHLQLAALASSLMREALQARRATAG